ncbi:MAG TPA: sulfatase [Planctomycetota bacterium]|nr:sulfatase [Planctomycetota bacterium]
MTPASPIPTPSQSHGGPTWLSRSLVTGVAVWLVLLGASLGASFALVEALHEIRAQHFQDSHFSRSAQHVLERAADHGALQGALTALWFLIGALLVSAYAPVRDLLDPRELMALYASRERLLRAQVTIALAFLATILFLAFQSPGITRAQVLLLAALAAIGIVALSLIARAVKKLGRSSNGTVEATAFAATAAAAVIATLGYVVDGDRIWRPFETETVVANLLLFLAAIGTFFVLRRAIREAWASQAPASRAALGGLRNRALLWLLVVPALSPLALRALGTVFGHSGIAPRPSYNVVVIGIDTLRADAVDWTKPQDGARDRTPNLRALGERGVRFSQAISQSSWTMPAFASIFTGKYPLEHGAVSLTGNLRDREFTLAEILREAGYHTGSFVSNDYTDQKHGFRQGNDEFKDDQVKSAEELSSVGVTAEAIDFVERHAGEPFYLFAHYMDPHYQYLDHEGWTWADDYQGWWKSQNDLDNLVRNRNLVSANDLRWLRDLYDEEVAFTDSQIGRLIEAVERSGVADRTLFVVVSDHGEEFLDHGNFSHTTTLYEELVHVPLLVVVPGAKDAGSQRDDVVETRAVFSTVLDCLGVDFAARSRPKGLLPAESRVAKEAQVPGEPPKAEAAEPRAFSMVWLPDAKPRWGKQFQIASLRTARWKLIHHITRDVRELFDLAADPGEKKDLAAEVPDVFRDLTAELDAWVAGQKLHATDLPRATIGSERMDRMRSLGYM